MQKRTLDASFNSAMSAHSFGYLINAPPPGTPNKDDLLALKVQATFHSGRQPRAESYVFRLMTFG